MGSAARKYLLSQQTLSGMTIFWQHPAEVNACAVALFWPALAGFEALERLRPARQREIPDCVPRHAFVRPL
jgi:hypothetical protein